MTMLKPLLIILFLAISTRACAQENLIPFNFTSEDENSLIKENDSIKYYVATGDTNNTVAINEEASWYKLYNKDHKLIAEGAFIMEGDKFLQDGKWVEKYDNGKIELTGYYHKNKPIGTWTAYYNSGKVKAGSNYGIVIYKGEPLYSLTGSYQEYYPGGTLKVSGFYSANVSTY